MSSFQVKVIPASSTYPLRQRVLWPHIEKESDCVIDIDDHPNGFHLGVFEEDILISIGSFFPAVSTKIESRHAYRLRAMATHPDFRGRDAGKALIQFGKALLKDRYVDVLWCDARLNAVPFYHKLGFNALDEIYEVRNIGPHKFMWIDLKD
ncbi:MAG: GNAT family N-acetyltransferase [Flavobacteriales bacterium]